MTICILYNLFKKKKNIDKIITKSGSCIAVNVVDFFLTLPFNTKKMFLLIFCHLSHSWGSASNRANAMSVRNISNIVILICETFPNTWRIFMQFTLQQSVFRTMLLLVFIIFIYWKLIETLGTEFMNIIFGITFDSESTIFFFPIKAQNMIGIASFWKKMEQRTSVDVILLN